MPIDFPYDELKARSVTLDIIGSVITGGLTQNGQQQVVNASGGGLISIQLSDIRMRRPEQIRAWRVLQFAQQGGVVPVNLELCEIRNGPRGGIPHSDLTPFSDLSFYLSNTATTATLIEPAELRATTVRMDFGPGKLPVGGEVFSMGYGDNRHELHVITSIDGDEFTFEPPLRADHTAGAPIEFAHPKITVTMRGSMAAPVDNSRFSTGQITFVEYLS